MTARSRKPKNSARGKRHLPFEKNFRISATPFERTRVRRSLPSSALAETAQRAPGKELTVTERPCLQASVARNGQLLSGRTLFCSVVLSL